MQAQPGVRSDVGGAMTIIDNYVRAAAFVRGHDIAADLLAAGLANTDPREG